MDITGFFAGVVAAVTAFFGGAAPDQPAPADDDWNDRDDDDWDDHRDDDDDDDWDDDGDDDDDDWDDDDDDDDRWDD